MAQRTTDTYLDGVDLGEINEIWESPLNELLDPAAERRSVTDEQLKLVQAIASGRIEFDVDNPKQVSQFLSEHERCFTGGKQGSLIHVALGTCLDGEFEIFKPLFRLVASRYPMLLEERNPHGDTTLHFAIQEGLADAAVFLCQHVPHQEDAARALSCTGRMKGNCLHAALRQGVKADVVMSLQRMCDTGTLRASDREGLTPLHIALNPIFSLGRIDEKLINVLIRRCPDAAFKVDEEGRSPLVYHVWARNKFFEYLRSRKASRGAEGSRSQIKTAVESSEEPTPKRDAYLRSGGAAEPKLAQQKEPLVKDRGNDRLDSVISSLQGISDRIIESLKILYLRQSANYGECIKLLYGGSELETREISFDLSGASNVNADSLAAFSRCLRFESILSYVLLPSRSLSSSQTKEGADINSREGNPQNVLMVLSWLRDMKVQKIIRLTVIDNPERPHSEEAIGAGLRGFGVQELDWRKPDICSTTIVEFAPDIHTLHLYWSGSNPVLRAWSEPEGLARLPNLVRVILNISQGVETRSRTMLNVSHFLHRFEHSRSQREARIRCIVERRFSGTDTEVSYLTSSAIRPSQEPWFSQLKKAAMNLMNLIHQTRRDDKNAWNGEVRVCLIDDGVDPSSAAVRGLMLASGRSFCRETAETGNITPWYASIAGHGTAMASLICRVAPMVKLCVAKVDTADDGLLPAQVIQALNWAVHKDVDIICLGQPVLWDQNTLREQPQDIVSELQRVFSTLHAGPGIPVIFSGVQKHGEGPETGGRARKWFDLVPADTIFRIGPVTAFGNSSDWGRPDGQGEHYLIPTEGLRQSSEDHLPASLGTGLDDPSCATALGCALAVFLVAIRRIPVPAPRPTVAKLRKAFDLLKERTPDHNFIHLSILSPLMQDDFYASPSSRQLHDVDQLARDLFGSQLS